MNGFPFSFYVHGLSPVATQVPLHGIIRQFEIVFTELSEKLHVLAGYARMQITGVENEGEAPRGR